MLEVNLERADLPLHRFYRSTLFGRPRGNLPRKILRAGAFLENYRTATQNPRLVRARDLFHLTDPRAAGHCCAWLTGGAEIKVAHQPVYVGGTRALWRGTGLTGVVFFF